MDSTTRLIVNADDFGQTNGVNAGIVEAHRNGILTSATLMANGAAFEDAVRLAGSCPELGVGVHLNLVEGEPVSRPSDVPSLLDRRGNLLSKFALVRRHLAGRLNAEQLRREVEAQIDRVLRADIVPTHVDSHKHVHAYPPFFSVVTQVARARGVGAVRLPLERLGWKELASCPSDAVRTFLINGASSVSRRLLRRTPLYTTDAFAGTLRTGKVTVPWLVGWIASLSHGTAELMVHPGNCDEELTGTGTRLTEQRETELRTLTDPQVAEAVRAAGVDLIHYGQVAAGRAAGNRGCGSRQAPNEWGVSEVESTAADPI